MKNTITLLLGIAIALSLNAQQLSDSLLLYYPLNGNATDVSINGFDGTNFGATPTTDRFGNPQGAMHFDGTSFINFPNTSTLKPDYPFSFSFWVKCDTTANYHNGFFSTEYSLYDYLGCRVNSYNGATEVSIGSGLGFLGVANRRSGLGSSSLATSVWYHYAVIVRGPTDMEVHITCNNLNLNYNGTGLNNVAYTNLPGSLGRINGGSHLKGSIDDFMYWNREITSNEIAQLCQVQQGGGVCLETFYDTVTVLDTVYQTIYDTTNVTIHDTLYQTIHDTVSITLYDTVYETIIDTTSVTVYDTVMIYDTITIVDTVVVEVPAGLINIDQSSFDIYPNPTNDLVYINNEKYADLPSFELRIFNVAGQEVMRKWIQEPNSVVDFSAFGESGLYLMQIRSSDGNLLEQHRIVVN
jgi:hypothetical protein